MKILLINDNPVVNKLVTLSAQKTSDELEVVASIDAIASSRYNLVVIDDALYSDDMFIALNEKISFDKSLYICSRDAKDVDGFSEVLKKPFLPTDLVEIFIKIAKSASDLEDQDDFTLLNEEIEPEIEDSLSSSVEDDLDDEILNLDKLDDLDNFELDDLNEDDISLDDETLGESVLDDEEAQKVKDLLDETEDVDEEDLNLDNVDLEDFDMEDDLDLESDAPLEEFETSTMDEKNLDIDNLETETQGKESKLEDLDLESQINSAVDALSDEDLEAEVDEETLGTIVSSDLDSLTSRDLKLAVGENIEPESELKETHINDEIETNIEKIADPDVSVVEDEKSENVEGVEALKTLLSALTDKNVVASMKGMKISINITLGDE